LPASARERLLFDLGMAFAARLDLDELIALVVRECSEALRAEGTSVLLLEPDGGHLVFPWVSAADPAVAARLATLRIPADRGVVGSVLRAMAGLRIDTAEGDQRFSPEADRATGFSTRALLCVPLRSRDGPIGVLEVVNPRDRPAFDDGDLRFLDALSGSVAIAIENARLYATVRSTASRLREQVGALRRDFARLDRFAELVGATPVMDEVRHLMDRAAASPITVLIEGETGTGKELVARGIHRAGERADAPFVVVNCAALAESLIESELFGHKRGAFTGALQDRAGYFEAAAGGTIFLDEIGEMPLPMQAKLLRVLQEGEVTPVGDHRPRKIDVRVIAATNRDLAADVAAERFRSDLYYRLAAFPIRLPPLRDRTDDLPLLTDRFLAAAAERHRKRAPGLLPATLELLGRWSWPGNVRELQNEIERAVALARDDESIGPDHLSERIAGTSPVDARPAVVVEDGSLPLLEAREAFEIRYLAQALRRHHGNVSRSARALGISRVMLQKKMKQFGLRDEE
jgi:transcriptional regulator with GAF, ATPase, and Fis domain